MTVKVIAYDTENPGDTSALAKNLTRFDPRSVRRLALLVKTEGNSDKNDFSREFGMIAARQALSSWGGVGALDRTTFLFSTGCEGAMTPFGYLFVDIDSSSARGSPDAKALVLGCARSRSLTGDEIGTLKHADIVADTVRAAMRDASVGATDVALVIVKTPVMHHMSAVEQSYKNRRITSAYSKAVGALGAGIALGEVDPRRVIADAFDSDLDLYARRAMVFSGSEIDYVEIMLLANRAGESGTLTVHTGQIADILDADGIKKTLRDGGCHFDSDGQLIDGKRIVAFLVKGGAAPDGRVRGYRTTIKSSHLDMDKHVRATLSGMVGSVLGHCRVFISANTVHQAPPGGGLCACIVQNA